MISASLHAARDTSRLRSIFLLGEILPKVFPRVLAGEGKVTHERSSHSRATHSYSITFTAIASAPTSVVYAPRYTLAKPPTANGSSSRYVTLGRCFSSTGFPCRRQLLRRGRDADRVFIPVCFELGYLLSTAV
eukprot:31384-Pelagococcus_subviridis.AAC.2